MRAAVLLASSLVAALASCHKSAAPVAVSTAEVDALWALAPADAIVGVVASPRAVAMAEHGAQDIRAYLAAVPELALYDKLLGAKLADLTGKPTLALADLGLAPAHGAALFVAKNGASLAIVPVGDRDRFLALVHGTRGAGSDADVLPHGVCKPLGELYACASSPELLAKAGVPPAAGAGSDAVTPLRARLDAVGARGDLEGIALALPLQPSAPIDLAGVVQLERGAVTLRVAASGVADTTIASLGTPAAVRADGDRTAGFAVVNLAKLTAQLPPLSVIEGVTLADLAHSLADPVTLAIGAGPFDLDAQVPLVDPAPMAQVVAHCRDFSTFQIFATTVDATGCHVPMPPLGLTFDLAIEGTALHVTSRPRPAAPAQVALTPLGAELAAGRWQLAFWGRGTILAPLVTAPPTPVPVLPDQAQLIVRGLGLVSEVGAGMRAEGSTVSVVVGLRTLWANPDDVVAKLTAVTPADIVSGRVTAIAQPVAAGAPDAPFARDYAAGYGGLTVPVEIVGILASVVIPAVENYVARSRQAPDASPSP